MSEISVSAGSSFVDRLFPPSWRHIGALTAVLLLLLLLVVTADNLWPVFWSGGYWSIMLIAPTIVVYILIVSRVLQPFQQRAVASLRRISALDDRQYAALVADTQARRDRLAMPALLFGLAIGLVPNLLGIITDGFSWLNLYFLLLTSLMFGLLVLVIQQALSESQLTHRLLQGPLDFDIFYTTPFLPIGLHSLVVALAFVGGSIIVLFFNAAGRVGFSFAALIVHGILALLTVLIFFLPLFPTHRVLRAAKLAELNILRQHMAAAYRRLEVMPVEEKQNILAFASEVSLWQQYEERLNGVPTWPYNAGMLRTLFVSIVLPAVVTLGQRVMAYVLVELGIN